MKPLEFIDESGSFTISRPENTSYLYFPLASETGLKSAVTPNLGGDAKLDQESFLLEPVSAENLHNNRSCRNFWFVKSGGGVYSAVGASAGQEAAKFSDGQDESELTAGFMWHTLKRSSACMQLLSTVTSFIPREHNVELMYITVQNTSEKPQELAAYAAVPIYGRSADNIRDHRNVTSMLHRIKTTKNSVFVCPTMSFDEKGHRSNNRIYFVSGFTGCGDAPESFYPTVEDFIGEGGSFLLPRAVCEQLPGASSDTEMAGKEAMGAFRFPKITLAPGEKKDYILLLGIDDSEGHISDILQKYDTSEKIVAALEETKNYWQNKVNVGFHTKDADFDKFMKWVCFQPFLRRLFGCSFLPHHDYGRGGRGWRDLWQDCLSLLLMEPGNVGQMIEKNYGGVRIDGTNATIIGEGNGNFLADRNGITRVWMDHALWPQMTTLLYINQTGDVEILEREVPYFKDAQVMRGTDMDALWNEAEGSLQKTVRNTVYNGSILEHLLVEQLTAFYEVGDHNIYRLRDADWNDALDMASERGESVAFTCAFAGNLLNLAEFIRLLDRISSKHSVELLQEIEVLLEKNPSVYDDIEKKHLLLNGYLESIRHHISGKRIVISYSELADDLEKKAAWLMEHIRKNEWIDLNETEGWFNSYYDNHGNAVEGYHNDHVRMMLTGQVFAVMSGVATDEQIPKIVKSADKYLYRDEMGGYCLNTNFHELKFDMGRMFGFAYGEKENGAVFSHMAVMYANALYCRGYVKEGWKALKSLADASLNFEKSRIYPGIPEYFRLDGRGMYHYLTGAASWYMMTMITEAFGVRGKTGDLIFYPKLLAEQFDDNGIASIYCSFAEKRFKIIYENKNFKDFGCYEVASASCDGRELTIQEGAYAVLSRKEISLLPEKTVTINIKLM